MLSNDVWRQLEIGHARQAGMADVRNSADSIFQRGVRSGELAQATRSGLQQIVEAKKDKRTGGDWGTTSSLDGILRIHSSEKAMKAYLAENVSDSEVAQKLLGSPKKKDKVAGTRLMSYPKTGPPVWDQIYDRESKYVESGGSGRNTVEYDTPEAGKIRGVRFESKKDPNSLITLFHIKEKL
jgi:hypothetical protein